MASGMPGAEAPPSPRDVHTRGLRHPLSPAECEGGAPAVRPRDSGDVAYEPWEDRLARWEREVGDARAALTLSDSIVMALRNGRSESGTSQRGQAESTGLSKSTVSRLESTPGRLKLDDVVAALAGTRFHLRLCHDVDGSPVRAQDWTESDLLGRDRTDRRLPAHAGPLRPRTTPTWFTARYGYDVPAPEWTWHRDAGGR